MSHRFDELKLSAYLDGELNDATMCEVEETIEKNEDVKRYVLDAIRSTVRLRSNMNRVLQEEIPERLLNTINPPQQHKSRRAPVIHQFIRIAAVLILMFVGFGTGMLVNQKDAETISPFMIHFPASFRQVVDDALEHNLSGTSKEWHSQGNSLRVTVTPVRTYRGNKNGLYYREYQMKVAVKDELRQLNGLAYRTTEGKWKNRALFFDTNGNAI